MEVWGSGAASPRGGMKLAKQLEANGWDGMMVVDSQNLSGDPYVCLAMAATVTTTLKLGTGVTNSITRHAAVTATAIASVHRVSGGRAVLGIGRGDSALAHLGRAPARLAQFERYLRHLQSYLRGEGVPFDAVDLAIEGAPPLDEMGLAEAPPDSRIAWLAGTDKVPVEVAATGPKVIAMAAVYADRVMFTLGADVERLSWGINVARRARVAAGLDPDGVAFGAFLNCACHPDPDTARDLVRGGMSTFARFNVMHGKTAGPWSANAEEALQQLHDRYDMRQHTRPDSQQAQGLDDAFIDQFAIAGGPDYCLERLQELAGLGLDKMVLGGRLHLMQTDAAQTATGLMEREVLPVLKGT